MVLTLLGKDPPFVEAHRVVTLAVAEVPLPEDRGLVPSGLQDRREGRLGTVEGRAQGRHAVDVVVRPGQDRRAARGADRVGAEAVVEAHPLGRQAVEVRRLVHPAAVRADRVRRVVIGHHEHDVRPPAHASSLARGAASQSRAKTPGSEHRDQRNCRAPSRADSRDGRHRTNRQRRPRRARRPAFRCGAGRAPSGEQPPSDAEQHLDSRPPDHPTRGARAGTGRRHHLTRTVTPRRPSLRCGGVEGPVLAVEARNVAVLPVVGRPGVGVRVEGLRGSPPCRACPPTASAPTPTAAISARRARWRAPGPRPGGSAGRARRRGSGTTARSGRRRRRRSGCEAVRVRCRRTSRPPPHPAGVERDPLEHAAARSARVVRSETLNQPPRMAGCRPASARR